MDKPLIVIFSDSDGSLCKESVPDTFDTICIAPLGDFTSVEKASDKIMQYKYVSFVHEKMEVSYEVLEEMLDKLKSNSVYGVVYSDYLYIVNRSLIPRLRRSYKKNKEKMVPVFGSVISEEMYVPLLSELISTDSLSLDSYILSDIDTHIPYHTPKFMFKA